MNKLILAGFASLLIALPVAEGFAQQEAAVELNGGFIQPHEARFVFRFVQSDGTSRPAGSWTDQVEVEGNQIIRTVVRYDDSGNVDLERMIAANHDSLLPTLMHQRFGEGMLGIMHVDYEPLSARQLLIADPRQPMRYIAAEFDEPVWELSLWGTLAMSMPFEEGSELRLPTISRDRQSVTHVTLRVEGNETVDVGGQAYEATRVTIPEANWTFWVRKEAPYIVRIEHPGPEGMTAVSELSTFE